MTKRPNSMRHLDDAIRRACGGSPERFVQARTIMANAVVASILPDGVIKGGSAIKMRFGDAATRFTTDLDTATTLSVADYIKRLDSALKTGWEGFTGRVVPRDPATPDGVPAQYVMRPFDVKLSYLGKPWCTVPLEVGHNEIGDADRADWLAPGNAAELFAAVGLPSPGQAPLMPVSYQVAQKIHGLTSPGDRVRDMIDLQIIAANDDLDLKETQSVCVRLFAYRQMQEWPPTVTMQPGWIALYTEQASDLPVLQNAQDAIAWTNDLIARIDGAE